MSSVDSNTRKKNSTLLWVLLCFVVLLFCITIVKIKGL
jgi:hypothetical protein